MSEHTADVAVVGAGPAGLSAAATAAEQGMRVLLIDAAPQPGGQIWRHRPGTRPPAAAAGWIHRVRRAGVEMLTGSEVVDATASGGALVLRTERSEVRVAQLVIATGARELFLPFPGWTLPGVTGVGGAQALLKAGWNVRGRRAVVAGSGPLLLPVAAALSRAGAHVVAVAEQAPRGAVLRYAASLWRAPRRLAAAARYRAGFAATSYSTGTWVRRAVGGRALEGVVLRTQDAERDVACDILCTGYGLVPATELARVLDCELENDCVTVDAEQRTSVAGVFCAGEPTGIAGMEASVVEGRIAGFAVAGVRAPSSLPRQRARLHREAARMHASFALRAELSALPEDETIVCRCEDARFADIARCGSAREAKLVTRMGMGACQGRVCMPAARHLFGWSHDSVRAPLFPARIDTMTGALAPQGEG